MPLLPRQWPNLDENRKVLPTLFPAGHLYVAGFPGARFSFEIDLILAGQQTFKPFFQCMQCLADCVSIHDLILSNDSIGSSQRLKSGRESSLFWEGVGQPLVSEV